MRDAIVYVLLLTAPCACMLSHDRKISMSPELKEFGEEIAVRNSARTAEPVTIA